MERDQQTPSTRGTQAHTDGRTPNGSEPTVVLKKYGNRRLYDTTASRYVTLVEVEAMVQQGTDILVVDARSGDDITREVLVQLLLERDSARASLPTGLLKQAVRLANSPLKEGLVKAMQEGLDTFMSGQRAVADAQRAISSTLTSSLSSSLSPWLPTTTPVPMWNPFPPPPPPGTPTAPAAAPPASVAVAPVAPAASSPSELESLRAELGQTQALVRQLLERELARTAHEASTTTTQAPSTAPTSTSTKKPARKKKS